MQQKPGLGTGAQGIWTQWNPPEPRMKTNLSRSPGSQGLPKHPPLEMRERVQLSVCLDTHTGDLGL